MMFNANYLHGNILQNHSYSPLIIHAKKKSFFAMEWQFFLEISIPL